MKKNILRLVLFCFACILLFVSCKKEFTVTVVSNNNEWGTVSGGGTYTEGTVISIEAKANNGCKFISWQDDNTENPRSATVKSDETFVAIFAQDVKPKDTTNVGAMNISNIQYTDCLSYLPSNDSIIVRKEGESLKIEHHNFAIPCKFDSIVVSYAFYGDTLAVTEMPDPYYGVNCVCVISNSFQINNIPHGQYVLVIGNYPYVIKHISSVNF